MELIATHVDRSEFFVRDLDARFVTMLVEFGFDGKSCLGRCVGNGINHDCLASRTTARLTFAPMATFRPCLCIGESLHIASCVVSHMDRYTPETTDIPATRSVHHGSFVLRHGPGQCASHRSEQCAMECGKLVLQVQVM